MRKVQVSISMYLKTKYSENFEWKKIFKWRFKSKQIASDKYFNKCLYYVNYNAVKHWIVEKIDDYPYSSIHQLLNQENKKRPVSTKQEKTGLRNKTGFENKSDFKTDIKINYSLENWIEEFFDDFDEFEF